MLTEQAAASGYKYRQRCDSTGNATKSKNHCTNIKESLFKMSSQLEGEILNVSDDESAPPVGLSLEVRSSVKRKHGPTAIHPIWSYFDDCDGGKSKKCLICDNVIKGQYTTNAEKHLLAVHSDKKKEYEEKRRNYETAKKSVDSDSSQTKIGNFARNMT